jgi:hypothetical protein
VGAPTSFFSEIYLQYLENRKIFGILVKPRIIGYFRYVDDILLVYQNNVTNIQCELLLENVITLKEDTNLHSEQGNPMSVGVNRRMN